MISLFARGYDRTVLAFVLIIVGLAVAVPVLNLALPPESPFHVPTYLVALWGKYACYAVLALAIDLIWGYCGILSLGHGAFFALGGYAMGMYLMRQIGTRGVYANPVLPDFMVFLNWDHLPFYWEGFDSFTYAAAMVLLVPGLLAFVFGWLAFRSRVTGVYFSIITQALTYALMLAFFRNNFGFGGNNGLTDFKDILGFNVQAAGTRNALFAISCAVLAAALVMCRAIVTSKFGKVLVAIRDAESRVRFLGYRPESYKLAVFTLSACMAGLAGALYVPQVGIINPSEFAPANSIEEVIWVAVGGRGTLTGAILGAVVVNYGKTYFTSGPLAAYWLFMLGGLFVSVTLMLPAGIIGAVQQRRYADLLRFGLLTGAILAYFTFGPLLFRAAFGVLLPDWLFVLGSLFVTLVLPAIFIALTGEGWSAHLMRVRLRILGPGGGLPAAEKT
jgi:urea transport system permease protein